MTAEHRTLPSGTEFRLQEKTPNMLNKTHVLTVEVSSKIARLTLGIGHFTVVYSVTRPMNGSRVVVMLTSLHLHKKSKEVCIKTRSPAASLPFIGRVTQSQL